MATATKSIFWGQKVPVPLGNPTTHAPVLNLGSITIGTTINDTLLLMRLPERVTIGANCKMILGDLDASTGLVLTLRLNNGTTQKVIIDAASTGQAGGIVGSTKIPTTETGVGFTTDSKLWWVEILVATAGTTPQAGIVMVQLDLCGFYKPGAVTE